MERKACWWGLYLICMAGSCLVSLAVYWWGIQIQEEGQRRHSLKGPWKAAGQFWVSMGNTEVCSGHKNKGLRDGA